MKVSVDECYWLDYLSKGEASKKVCILKYNPTDITLEKTNDAHISKLIESHFGKRSMKSSNTHFHRSIADHHEAIRSRIFHEAGPLVIAYYCSLANIVGLYNHGGGSFIFKNIADELVHKWTLDSFVRTFFVLRGAWDDNPKWTVQAEIDLMENIGIRYTQDFQNETKKSLISPASRFEI